MTQDFITARDKLLSSSYTCVLCRNDSIRTASARGVTPLLDFLAEGGFQGYTAADKVVGKATAFLYVLLGVHAVYARVASEEAVKILRRHGIELQADLIVPAIFNRSRTGFCPMETAVREIEEPDAALAAIRETYRSIHKL